MSRSQREAAVADHAGPTLGAAHFLPAPATGRVSLLSPHQRQRLLEIATRVSVPPRMILYRENTAATTIFFIADGVVKVFKDFPSGRRWVTGFLFPHDLVGLAQNGLYVRTAQTITPATLYRVKVADLERLLRGDPELGLHFLFKVTHELREAQRQTIVVGRRDAIGRVAMFIRELEQHTGTHGALVEVPMTRTDAASYLGLSAEAVSRAIRLLEQRGIVTFTERHRARILDRRQFDRLVSRL
jgi:CRP/FNR family transcriptional regulator, anaerobic regulatory protein